MYTEHSLDIDTTGAAGEASGDATLEVPGSGPGAGYVEWVEFAFHDDAPAATCVRATFVGDPPSGTIFTLKNTEGGSTRKSAVDSAGNPMVGAAIRLPAASLSVSVSDCDPLTAAVTVTMCVTDR